MIRRFIALFAGALALTTFTALPVYADNDRDDRGNPSIHQVIVVKKGPGESTLTIKGRNLQGRAGRDETRVMLGGQGPFELVEGSTENELVVRCNMVDPMNDTSFDCDEGDYKLSLAIVRPRSNRRGKDRFDIRGRTTYDLTIGASGGDSVACPCFTPQHVFGVVFGAGQCTVGPGLINGPDKEYVVALPGEDINVLDFAPSLSVKIGGGETGEKIFCSANIKDWDNVPLHSTSGEVEIDATAGMACLTMIKTAFECTNRY